MTDRELREFAAEHFTEMKELRATQRETAEQLTRTERIVNQVTERMKQTDEQMKKTDERMRQTDELIKQNAEQMKKTDKKIAELGRQFGDFGNRRGEEAENFFFRYFEGKPRLGSVVFNEVRCNVNAPGGGEHDIVLLNDTVSALISVKYKLHKTDVDNLLGKETERFKRLLRKLGSTHSFYAGVAAFILDKWVEDYAIGKGLWVVSRSGKNSAVVNGPAFEARRFG